MVGHSALKLQAIPARGPRENTDLVLPTMVGGRGCGLLPHQGGSTAPGVLRIRADVRPEGYCCTYSSTWSLETKKVPNLLLVAVDLSGNLPEVSRAPSSLCINQ